MSMPQTQLSQRSSPMPSMAAAIFPFLRPYAWRAMLFLLALLMTTAATLALGQGLKMIIDQGMAAQSKDSLLAVISFTGALGVIIALGTYVRFYMISWLGERVSADIRRAVFDHLLTLHPAFFEVVRSGNIISRLTADTTLLQSIVGSGLSLALRSAVTFCGALVMMIATDPALGAAVLVGVPLLTLPVLAMGKKVRSLSQQSQESLADVGSYAGEIVQQIKIVQSFTREALEKIAFSAEVERAFEIANGRIRYRARLTVMIILAVFGVLLAIIWNGGSAVLDGQMTGGDLAAFIFYALLMATAVATLAEVYGELQRAAGATERLVDLLHAQSDILSPSDVSGESLVTDNLQLHFHNVTFNYETRPDTPAINGFSLDFEVGKVIALVGPSGAGKSTLFDLIQRFYDPKEGYITLAGRDLRDFNLAELRAKVGLVQQQPTLFSGTVRHNIGYGCETASDDEVIAAATAAQAHDFIMQLPLGYDSDLGEQGVRLSGGQRQRIAIARVLLKNPPILLLDEATSALDAQSEQAVKLALDLLMAGRTTIIIAHRLATIVHADKIAVVDNGRLIAAGSHQQLLSSSPLYRRLAKLQFTDGGAPLEHALAD